MRKHPRLLHLHRPTVIWIIKVMAPQVHLPRIYQLVMIGASAFSDVLCSTSWFRIISLKIFFCFNYRVDTKSSTSFPSVQQQQPQALPEYNKNNLNNVLPATFVGVPFGFHNETPFSVGLSAFCKYNYYFCQCNFLKLLKMPTVPHLELDNNFVL